jgi:hypothetical protein
VSPITASLAILAALPWYDSPPRAHRIARSGSTLRSSPSWLLAPGRGRRSRRPPRRLDRGSSSTSRTTRGAPSRSTPPTSKRNRPRFGGDFFWRWGESNPRPRARTANIYRFIRPFGLSRRGQRDGAPSLPYPDCVPGVVQARRRASLGRLRASRPFEAARSRARRLSTLTRRERGCRCCWHLSFCRIRRSAAPPAARDPDRPGRDRYTPYEVPYPRIAIHNIGSSPPPGQCFLADRPPARSGPVIDRLPALPR